MKFLIFFILFTNLSSAVEHYQYSCSRKKSLDVELMERLGTITCTVNGKPINHELKEDILAAISVSQKESYQYSDDDFLSFQFCAKQGEKILSCTGGDRQDGASAQWNSVTKLLFYQFLKEKNYLDHEINFHIVKHDNFCGFYGMANPNVTLDRLKQLCGNLEPCLLTQSNGRLIPTTLKIDALKNVYSTLRDNSNDQNKINYTKKIVDQGVSVCDSITSTKILNSGTATRPYKVSDVMNTILNTSDGNAITELKDLWQNGKKISVEDSFKTYLTGLGISNQTSSPLKGGAQSSCVNLINKASILNNCNIDLPKIGDGSSSGFVVDKTNSIIRFKSGSNAPEGEISGLGHVCASTSATPLIFAINYNLNDIWNRAYSEMTMPSGGHLLNVIRNPLYKGEGVPFRLITQSNGNFDKLVNKLSNSTTSSTTPVISNISEISSGLSCSIGTEYVVTGDPIGAFTVNKTCGIKLPRETFYLKQGTPFKIGVAGVTQSICNCLLTNGLIKKN